MKKFLSMVGSIVSNFILWALITKLPMHPIINFALVILIGILMLYALIRFSKTTNGVSST